MKPVQTPVKIQLDLLPPGSIIRIGDLEIGLSRGGRSLVVRAVPVEREAKVYLQPEFQVRRHLIAGTYGQAVFGPEIAIGMVGDMMNVRQSAWRGIQRRTVNYWKRTVAALKANQPNPVREDLPL